MCEIERDSLDYLDIEEDRKEYLDGRDEYELSRADDDYSERGMYEHNI